MPYATEQQYHQFIQELGQSIDRVRFSIWWIDEKVEQLDRTEYGGSGPLSGVAGGAFSRQNKRNEGTPGTGLHIYSSMPRVLMSSNRDTDPLQQAQIVFRCLEITTHADKIRNRNSSGRNCQASMSFSTTRFIIIRTTLRPCRCSQTYR